MAGRKHTVTMINPKPAKRGKRKASTVAKRRRKRSTRKGGRRKTARRAYMRTAAPKRRRRRRANPTRRPSRPRRRNPNGRWIHIDLRDDLKHSLYRLGGKMISAFAVRRWGDPEGAQPSGVASPTTGARWTLKNLFIAWLAGAVGGELVARFFSREGGQHVYDGSVDLALTKAFWSEVIHRIGGPGGAAMFGQADDQMAVLASQADEGDIIDDGQGNRWLLQGGQWVSMQGHDEYGDVLAEATPLDGYQQRMLQEGAYDGVLETATPLDDWDDGIPTYETEMGHLMDPAAPGAASAVGTYTRRGSPDPFHASYM